MADPLNPRPETPTLDRVTTPADLKAMSDAEEREIRTEIVQAQKDFEKDLEKLRQQYNQRVLDAFPPAAGKQLSERIGDVFQFERR